MLHWIRILTRISTEKEEEFRQTMWTCSLKSNFINWDYLAEIPGNGIDFNSDISVADPNKEYFLEYILVDG